MRESARPSRASFRLPAELSTELIETTALENLDTSPSCGGEFLR